MREGSSCRRIILAASAGQVADGSSISGKLSVEPVALRLVFGSQLANLDSRDFLVSANEDGCDFITKG